MPLLNSSAPRGLTITEAKLPLTYSAGLEYSAPARGTWTIMHLGLLIPETHIIFVCARCCLRGVSMSAAELRALDRFSTITIEDRNLLEGDTEKALIDGVTDILSHLTKRPRGVIIYTSCVHEFIGSDLTFSFETLRERFPDIRFTDGYMTPILRKRITPDKRNRRQIYTLLQTSDVRDNGVTVVGDVRPMAEHSDFRALVEAARLPWRSITATRTWADYQALGESRFAVTFNPTADAAIDWMAEHLGQKVRQFSAPWLPEAIEKEKTDLARFLGIALTDESERRNEALAALENARTTIGRTPIALDYTATTRPLSLARLLVRYGFNVVRLYIDGVLPEETEDFEALKTEAPALKLFPTVAARMVRSRQEVEQKVLAVGQKAAWYEHTDHFVNMVEGDGADGWRGILYFARLLTDAFLHAKPAKDVIQIKALGCTKGGCL